MVVPHANSLERLRESNRRAITALLAVEGPMSRADLVRGTGLSRTTVSSLVGDLIATGQVVETADRGRPHKGGSGRPPLLVALAAPGGGVAGVDIGHRHVRVAVADRRGAVLAEQTEAVDVDEDGHAALDRAARMVRQGLERAELAESDLAAVGMCVPAPLDRRSARVRTGILPGWREISPAEELHRRLDVPVFADNDANLGALAELREGVGRQLRDFVYVFGENGTGVGAGIIAGGELFRGPSGFGGEIGHMPLARRGPLCSCGNRGCLEVLAGRDALLRLAGLDTRGHGNGRDDAAQAELLARAQAGEARTSRALAEVARALATGMTSLANVLSPEAIVLGGYYATLAEWLVPRIEREVAERVLGARWSSCRVLVSTIGEQAAVRGAAAFALHEVLADPTTVGLVSVVG